MSTLQNRLKKIALSLTPKQAVLASITEHQQQFDLLEGLSRWISEPQNRAQVHQRWQQVDDAITRAAKGQDKAIIQKARQQAREEIVFLLSLHQGANIRLLEKEPKLRLKLAYLVFEIQTYVKEHLVSNRMIRAIEAIGDTPCPLDKDTAAMAHSLVDHAVHSLSITDHQVSEWLETQDDTAMAYERLMEAVKDLIKKGQVHAGKTVGLMTIPIMGFREVPIIEGD